MKPYYEDSHIKIYNKDCRDMSELADDSVQCVVRYRSVLVGKESKCLDG